MNLRGTAIMKRLVKPVVIVATLVGVVAFAQSRTYVVDTTKTVIVAGQFRRTTTGWEGTVRGRALAADGGTQPIAVDPASCSAVLWADLPANCLAALKAANGL